MLLMTELFKGFRAEIVQRRVSPTPIVERFDVEEQVRPSFITSVIDTMVYPFAFQRAKEALHRRIVVPTADAVHARLDAMGCQQHLIASIRVLTALLRVVDACQIK